eukprot:scaffold28234_cov19-Tisochrysis_lutea.AAC.1
MVRHLHGVSLETPSYAQVRPAILRSGRGLTPGSGLTAACAGDHYSWLAAYIGGVRARVPEGIFGAGVVLGAGAVEEVFRGGVSQHGSA